MVNRTREAHGFELAELNIARLLEPLDSPRLAGFVAGLEPVNAAADAAPGFVWRLKDESTADATSFRIFEDDWLLVNMSVWTTHEALHAFVYDELHRAVLRQRRDWFEHLAEAVTVLWWVPAGSRPTVAEAQERLEHLRKHGTTPYAFGLRDTVAPPAPGADYAPQ
ncbi:DUF3291 domain-containing protein [Actinocrinis puniceicyclus]|uniref:DUF3291 domain-containing protein n=1 Tax=Actinocrinis puniceicyclus TaxID=977794 RepID=A0A8J8BB24_9ACTN|nr:DUF3291 domain-containing protein [Actinocrinis puniceicyclus]MBS2961656.1 DUF3291 domain-containing protein [Actinocrinis puniceicyclus]